MGKTDKEKTDKDKRKEIRGNRMKRLHRKIKALALVFLVFAGTIQAPVQAISARAEEPVKISYQAFNYPTAWSDKEADDTP